jgi:UDP-2,4-diacetamido-2,4,6-trideoxy-beta-L-altropyranose hydrolase
MRCLALAETFHGVGWKIVFQTNHETLTTVPALARSGFQVEEPGTMDRNHAPGSSVIVVDHYAIAAADEERWQTNGDLLVVIDDLADRPHRCAILVDPTPRRSTDAYADLVPRDCTTLVGPRYAPIRPSWRHLRRRSLERRTNQPNVDRIIVSFGSTDPGDATSRILDALAALDLRCAIDVVLGPSAPHLARVAGRSRPEMRLHVDPHNLPSLVADADFAIGAPGSSSFERAVLGVPMALFPVADNQLVVGAALAACGAAAVFEATILDDHLDVACRLQLLLADSDRRRSLSRSAQALTDGCGPLRLLLAIAGTHILPDGRSINLRLADDTDSDFLLALQCRPETRRFARNKTSPTAEGHARWLADTFDDTSRLLCVIELERAPVGMVRIDRISDVEPCFEVSIAVVPELHGYGIGRAALALIRRVAPGATFDATIHPDNAASRAMFATAGYRQVESALWRSVA